MSSIIKSHELDFFPNYMEHTVGVYKVVFAIFILYTKNELLWPEYRLILASCLQQFTAYTSVADHSEYTLLKKTLFMHKQNGSIKSKQVIV